MYANTEDLTYQPQQHFKTMIEEIIVVGLNKNCKSCPDDIELKWVTSLEIVDHSQYESQQLIQCNQNQHIKYREIGNELYLKIWFCQNDKKPIIKIKSSKLLNNNEAFYIAYPNQRLEEEYLCYITNQKQTGKRIIEDIQMVEVSAENDLQMPEDNSIIYEVVRLPNPFQKAQQQNSSNEQLMEKTRYLLVKTLDLDDQQHHHVQHFEPEVIFQHSMKNKSTQIQYQSFHFFCFPQGIILNKNVVGYGYSIFNFILTQEDGTRIYVNCLKLKQQLQQSIIETLPSNCIDKHIHKHQKLFTEKAVCILSKYCCTNFFHNLLEDLFRKYQSLQNQQTMKMFPHSRQDTVQFQQVILQFINKYEIGYRDCQTLFQDVQYMKEDIRLDIEWNNNRIVFPLPNQQINRNYSPQAVHCLFKMLSVDKIVSIVQALLLQKSVIFVSESQVVVGYTIQALVSFLYPLRWQHVMLPMLPSKLLSLLQAPMPLIAGIPTGLATDEVIHNIKQDSMIVFLDCNDIFNKDQQRRQLLHVNHFKQATKKLRLYDIYQKRHVSQMLNFKDQFYLFKIYEKQQTHFSAEHIKHIFFQTILLLLQNYQNYYSYITLSPKGNQQMKQPQVNGLKKRPFNFKKDFLLNEFISSHPKINMSFMKKFTETSHFISFLYQYYDQQQNPQKDFIDNALRRQKNNKITQNIFGSRYSEKLNNTYIYNANLRKQVSLPTTSHNVTWSPPPKKSEVTNTNYSRNGEQFSIKIEDVQMEKQKSMTEEERHINKSHGKTICQAITRAMLRVSNTKRNLIIWTQARVTRLKKQFFGNKQKQKDNGEQVEDNNQMPEKIEKNMVQYQNQEINYPQRKNI